MRAATRLLNKQEPSPKSDSEIFADNLNRRLGRHRIGKIVMGNFDGSNPLGLAKVIASKRTHYYVTSKGSAIKYPALLIDNEGQRRFQEIAQKLEARKHPLTITLGHWTLHGNDNFIGLTVHFLDNEWHLHSHILGHVFAPGD